jgi:hypothetical protein
VKIFSDGGAVVDEEDREEAGQEVQTPPERPQDLRQGINMIRFSSLSLSLSLSLCICGLFTMKLLCMV